MRRRYWRFWSGALCVTVGLATLGCYGGDGLPRQPIAGAVTLDGRPLHDGMITFYPAARMLEGDLTVAGAMIKNGRFSIPRKYGLIPGTFKIGVHSGDTNGDRGREESDPDRDSNVVSRELVPEKYNSDTTLEVEITDHAVKEMKIELESE